MIGGGIAEANAADAKPFDKGGDEPNIVSVDEDVEQNWEQIIKNMSNLVNELDWIIYYLDINWWSYKDFDIKSNDVMNKLKDALTHAQPYMSIGDLQENNMHYKRKFEETKARVEEIDRTIADARAKVEERAAADATAARVAAEAKAVEERAAADAKAVEERAAEAKAVEKRVAAEANEIEERAAAEAKAVRVAAEAKAKAIAEERAEDARHEKEKEKKRLREQINSVKGLKDLPEGVHDYPDLWPLWKRRYDIIGFNNDKNMWEKATKLQWKWKSRFPWSWSYTYNHFIELIKAVEKYKDPIQKNPIIIKGLDQENRTKHKEFDSIGDYLDWASASYDDIPTTGHGNTY